MSGEEAAAYLVHHLALAGRTGIVFTSDAITLIRQAHRRRDQRQSRRR
jgi:type II secretory pathway predicted ATPase ExeA